VNTTLLVVPSLIVPSANITTSAVPDPVQEIFHPNKNEPNTAEAGKSNWKSTASATAKLLLRGVNDSADAFGPLKSVAGGLCFILENCEVRPPASECTIRETYRYSSGRKKMSKR